MPPLDNEGQQLFSLLQQYPQNPGGVIPQIRTMADAGDRRARAMAGYYLVQQGQLMEAASYIRAAALEGATYLAGYLAQNAAGQPDPQIRTLTSEFVRLAPLAWPGFDPYSLAQQLAQQGDAQQMQDVLDAAYESPPGARELQTLVDAGRQQVADIRSTMTEATQARDAALATFAELTANAHEELEGLKRVAREAGALASDTSSEVQAREYGNRAKTSEERANLFTTASIGLAVLIAMASVAIAIVSVRNSDKVGEGLQKAAFALPFLALNAYLAGLAREARREALRWRHVQLQLSSIVPFLGALDEDHRKDVQALLALRFFPGQPLPDGSEMGDDREADAAALATLLSETRKAVAPTPVQSTPG